MLQKNRCLGKTPDMNTDKNVVRYAVYSLFGTAKDVLVVGLHLEQNQEKQKYEKSNCDPGGQTNSSKDYFDSKNITSTRSLLLLLVTVSLFALWKFCRWDFLVFIPYSLHNLQK